MKINESFVSFFTLSFSVVSASTFHVRILCLSYDIKTSKTTAKCCWKECRFNSFHWTSSFTSVFILLPVSYRCSIWIRYHKNTRPVIILLSVSYRCSIATWIRYQKNTTPVIMLLPVSYCCSTWTRYQKNSSRSMYK